MPRTEIENIEQILNQPQISDDELQKLENNILSMKDHIRNNGWQIQLGTKSIAGDDCTKVVTKINYLLLTAKFQPYKLPNDIKNIFAI